MAGLVLVLPGLIGVARLGLLTPLVEGSASRPSSPRMATDVSKKQTPDAHAKRPLTFTSNADKSDSSVRYSAQGPGFAVTFTPREALLSFIKGERGHILALRFLGALPNPTLTARGRLPGLVNYLIGDQTEWRTRLPTYQEIVYKGLWPGVDAVFRGVEGKLKYEFHLAPGARVSDIRLSYAGADGLSLERRGDLLIETPLGTLRDAHPVSYELINAGRVAVESRYVLGRDGTYGFAIGSGNDTRSPLVIDPGLAYSTFLGGSEADQGFSITVDRAGQAYFTGETNSSDFPTTPGGFDTSHNGSSDVFITKLSADGGALLYSTFLGGSFGDVSSGIAVDQLGHAFVTGRTGSSEFPTTPGAFDPSYNGGGDAFVTKLSPDGAALVYSTYLGGSGIDQGTRIAVDQGGHAYVAGYTRSLDFPTTPGAFDTTQNGDVDAFISDFRPDGSALAYSTFLGGSGNDVGWSIAIDAGGHAYVTGGTSATTVAPVFPTTPGAFDRTFNGARDGFITKLTPDGSALVYSTLLGGKGADGGVGIAVDSGDRAFVAGSTHSPDFPTTPGAFDPNYNDGGDAFVTKLSADGSALAYGTFLGGNEEDFGRGVAIDPAGHGYVTGGTSSPDFPTTPGAFDPSYNDGVDAFVTKLSPDGSALAYGTFLGGSNYDFGAAICVATGAVSLGVALVIGNTNSPDFPTTPGAFDPSYNGVLDAFIVRFVIDDVTMP